MSFVTNCTAEFFSLSNNWEGKETETSLGSYDCWNEESSIYGYIFPWMTARKTAKDSPLQEIGKGTLFVFDEISLKAGYKFTIGNESYSIVGLSKFSDCSGNFHHAEVAYK